jgi:hypothetical protein
MKNKFKPGQLVRKKKAGINLHYVVDTKYPMMLIYTIQSQFLKNDGTYLEVNQSDYERV